MLFIARCIFWLGLVYLAMARDAGVLPSAIDFQPQQAAASAAKAVGSACVRTPDLCLRAARTAAALGSASADAAHVGAQTLGAADLALPWRGKTAGRS